ncbi:MAG: Mth938-like domain-containing protein [Proteobacteria bacterium]|nr:Mth938-like domain-containing protein [Pseudomonadota bacterium]
MKLHASAPTALNTFTGYGPGFVLVNDQRHATSLIVMPELLQPWGAGTFAGLEAAHFALIASLQPEVVLLGTGDRIRFPHPSLTRALAEARIGIEVMDLQAACRTYNILMAEQRKVAAALLFE